MTFVIQWRTLADSRWRVVEADYTDVAAAQGRQLALALQHARHGGEWRVCKATYEPVINAVQPQTKEG